MDKIRQPVTPLGAFMASSHMTDSEMAAALGVSLPTIANWRRSKCNPQKRLIDGVKQVLGVNIFEMSMEDAAEAGKGWVSTSTTGGEVDLSQNFSVSPMLQVAMAPNLEMAVEIATKNLTPEDLRIQRICLQILKSPNRTEQIDTFSFLKENVALTQKEISSISLLVFGE